MTPVQAAAFLRAQADAILASGESVSIRLELRTLGSEPMTGAERAQKHRATRRLDRYDFVTPRDGDWASLPQTPSASQEGSDLEIELKAREKAQEIQKELPVISGACEAKTAPESVTKPESVTLVQPPGRTQKRERRGKLSHFVPDDWTVKPSHRTLALGLLVDVEAEAAKFRAHEFHTPRSDWDRAFSGWVRRSPEMTRRGIQNGGEHPLVSRMREIQAKGNGSAGNGSEQVGNGARPRLSNGQVRP